MHMAASPPTDLPLAPSATVAIAYLAAKHEVIITSAAMQKSTHLLPPSLNAFMHFNQYLARACMARAVCAGQAYCLSAPLAVMTDKLTMVWPSNRPLQDTPASVHEGLISLGSSCLAVLFLWNLVTGSRPSGQLARLYCCWEQLSVCPGVPHLYCVVQVELPPALQPLLTAFCELVLCCQCSLTTAATCTQQRHLLLKSVWDQPGG